MSEAAYRIARPLQRLWRRGAPLLVVNAFYFGVLVYPVLRIRLLLDPTLPGTPELLAIMVGPVLGRLAYEFFPGTLTRWLANLALTWLGICFLAFLLVLGFELVHLFLPLTDFAWGAILSSTLAALGVLAFINAQRLHIRELHVAAPESLDGVRIAQISDVHVGSRSGRFLRRVVQRVNEAAPDYVLITGDLIDYRNIPEHELSSLADLRAPAWFIIGNHERYVDTDAICARLTRLGIDVIRNGTRELPGIQLIGIDDADPRTQVAAVLAGLSPSAAGFRVLLYHRPDGAEDAARWGAHLMLCGHTHNGQIVPFNYVVKRIFPRIHGFYRIGHMHLYVNPGTGTWGPMLRLGSRSEISLFTLRGHRANASGEPSPCPNRTRTTS